MPALPSRRGRDGKPVVTTAILQRFANIRRDEAGPTLVAGLFFFCVLTALMVVRPAREALGMQRGIEAIRWLFIGTVVVTLLVNPIFGLLVSRFRRLVFINATYLFFAFGLLAFYALLVLAPASIGQTTGQVFYVWFSVFNLFATMLFWALMADRFSLEQSKRLFGAIAVGGTLGAIFGPWLASLLAKPLGTPSLLLVAAGFLLLALGAAWWLTRLRTDRSDRDDAPASTQHAVIGGSAWEGFQSVFRSPYLLAICAYVLILAVMATFLYFTRLQMVAALGTNLDMRTATFAQIDMITQVATLVLQAVVTGHLMKRLGVSVTLALLPITVALGFIGLAIIGSLAALIAFEATFRAVQRGIMRPARETLFTIVPRADRYKSKAFIDTFVYRAGDVIGAQTEGLLGRLGMGLAALASFAVPLAMVWMALGLWLGYAQRERAAREPHGIPAEAAP
ncbi:MAG: MFS transporter [Betaproteobacteria bacterium]|nr:MFS transporter [Betaproteobacteria bacterium]